MTSVEKEALEFLRDFEISTRSYFLRKGIGDNELPTAVLEAQWQLLHSILRSKLSSRQRNYRTPRRVRAIKLP